MKSLYKFIHITGPLTLALLLSVNANAAAVNSTVPNTSFQKELAVGGGGDEKTDAKAKAEAKKPLKPKKLKARRVNHGPKRPIFPGTDRKKDKLSRARHLNSRR